MQIINYSLARELMETRHTRKKVYQYIVYELFTHYLSEIILSKKDTAQLFNGFFQLSEKKKFVDPSAIIKRISKRSILAYQKIYSIDQSLKDRFEDYVRLQFTGVALLQKIDFKEVTPGLKNIESVQQYTDLVTSTPLKHRTYSKREL